MKSIQRLLLSAVLSLGFATLAQGQNTAPPPAPAPPPPPGTVHVITYIDVPAAAASRAAGVLKQYRDGSKAEAGNLSLEMYQELNRTHRFAIDEQWRDKQAFEAHKAGNATAQFLSGLKALKAAPVDSRVFQGVLLGPVKPRAGGNGQVYGISRFQIPAARMAEFSALAKPYVETSRPEKGAMRFDVLQEMSPRESFVTVFETWNLLSDFEVHRLSAHDQKFREGLAPMTIGGVDDRFYGKFN